MDKRLCENIKNKVGVSVLSKDGILRTCIVLPFSVINMHDSDKLHKSANSPVVILF